MTFQDRVEKILSQLPHRLCVEFALYCCNDIKELITDPDSIKAVELTQKWLDTNGEGVTKEELRAAAATYATATYAVYTTDAAYSAAYSAAYAVHIATTAAAYAVYTAASAAEGQRSKEKQYLNHLAKIIANLSELERVLWDVEEIT